MSVHTLAAEQLQRWGIPEAVAAQAGIHPVDDASTICRSFKRQPALHIPYRDVAAQPLRMHTGEPFCRVRYLGELPAVGGFASPAKPQRYSQPPDSGCFAYFPPGLNVNADCFVITEGEAKALAAQVAGIDTIALGGVANIYNRDGQFLPELVALDLMGRVVIICFDSDAATNPNIQSAEARLAEELLKLGASVKLARLPGNADGSKVGIDDYLLAEGVAALKARLAEAQPLGRLDAAIMSLNKHVAWVEFEAMLFNLDTNKWIRKDAFVNGSEFSALSIPVTVSPKGGRRPKDAMGEQSKVYVAPAWLRSPLARRYTSALFRPGEGPEVLDEGARALNLWTGLKSEPGDVGPFLDLSKYLFGELPEQHQDMPLRWLAYKAQNPGIKIPLALVLLGQEGVGKSFWTSIVREAFAPYGHEMASAQLRSDFQGWLERTLIAVINEAEGEDVTRSADVLKSLISEEVRPMNEKFRPVRQVRTYTSYILTSNRRSVGAYSADNRRMFVVNTPAKPRAPEFYETLGNWFKHGKGAKAVMHWLLNVDLGGWKPPARAPATAEKLIAYKEGLTPIQELAYDCLHGMGGTNIIRLFLDKAREQATLASSTSQPGPHLTAAARTLQALETMQIRPFYTAKEIALLFPDISATLYGNRKLTHTPAGEISRQLREAGIPYLKNSDDPGGFMYFGRREQYLVLADFDDWRQPITQAQFDQAMRNFPRYAGGTRT